MKGKLVPIKLNDDLKDSLELEEDSQIFEGEIAISFLVVQHKTEILDKLSDYKQILEVTFSDEFMNMVQMCSFVPFLHPDTPRPQRIPKSQVIDHK